MKVLILITGILICKITACQSIEFFRENLIFSLDSVNFTVNGTYFIRNTSKTAASFLINYPIPGSLNPDNHDTLIVQDMASSLKFVKVTQKDTLYTFHCNIESGSDKELTIAYRLRHNGNSVRYILTTTSYWGKPLEVATYDLIIPNYIKISGFSFEPDSSTVFQTEKVYHWKKKDFFPDKEILIHFIIAY